MKRFHECKTLWIKRTAFFSGAAGYVQRLLSHMSNLGYGSLSTLMGRYYAMDRDKRYERNKLAFEGFVKGIGERVELEGVVKVRV